MGPRRSSDVKGGIRLRRLVVETLVASALITFPIPPIGVGAASASTPTHCRASTLLSKVAQGGAAAGTTYFTLLFIYNKTSGSCSLMGTPNTRLGIMTGSGGLIIFRAVGPAATKLVIARRGRSVTLRPGVLASVTIGIATAANYVPSKCHVASASMVRTVFKSGATFYFGLPTVSVCSRLASTTTSGVVLGLRYASARERTQ